MRWIILSAIASTLLLIFAIITIIRKQPKLNGNELAKVVETPMTGVMGLMLYLLCYALLITKHIKPDLGGIDMTSYKFVAVYAFICAICGYEVLLFTFVKKVIAYEDRIEYYNSLGVKRVVLWSRITEVKVPVLSNRATFKTLNDTISVNGEPVSYAKFISVARKKISPIIASDDLSKLYSKVNRGNKPKRNFERSY